MQTRAQSVPAPTVLRALWLGLLALAFAIAQTTTVAARGAPESFADLSDKVSPAVVNITTSTTVAQSTERGPMLPEGSPFNDLFRDFLGPQGEGRESQPQRSQALGSGFVISEDGFIVTNNHVIEGADDIEIEFFSGERLKAKVIGTDANTDLAVLKVESDTPLAFVPFGDSDAMRVGDWVLAVGNPLGQGFSVSAGIVSARGRSLQGNYDDYIQTDAAINRGNSGGPLFNMEGEVVGVNTAILSPTGGSIGIGFAMASNVTTKVVQQLREFGETRRGWLGVRIQDVTADIAEAMSLDKPTGILVSDVPEGPARAAGMLVNDVIVAFDGAEVEDTRGLMRRVADAEIGKAVPVEVIREGKPVSLSVTLGRRETDSGEGAPARGDDQGEAPAPQDLLGMTLRVPNDQERDAAGMTADVSGLLVVEVKSGSEADEKGIQAGDVITQAGQKPVASPEDLSKRMTEAREAGNKALLLLVRRAGDQRFVALPVN